MSRRARERQRRPPPTSYTTSTAPHAAPLALPWFKGAVPRWRSSVDPVSTGGRSAAFHLAAPEERNPCFKNQWSRSRQCWAKT